MKKNGLLFLFLLLNLSLSVFPARAQDTEQSYGLVRQISGNEMTVSVYDPRKEAVHEEVFTLTPETELVIVRPATEVVEGDEVQVTYTRGKKTRTARYVSILDLPAPENSVEASQE